MQYGFDDEYDLGSLRSFGFSAFIFLLLIFKDIGLEFEESERYENFRDFYYDVRPEFERFGRVITFLVCSNAQVHLRGNVYVQYETYVRLTFICLLK